MFSDNLELLNEYVVLVEMAKPEITIGFIISQVLDKAKNDPTAFNATDLARLENIKTNINWEEFNVYCGGWDATNTWNSGKNSEEYILQFDSILTQIQTEYFQHKPLLDILSKINLTIIDFKFIVIIYRKLFQKCFKIDKKE